VGQLGQVVIFGSERGLGPVISTIPAWIGALVLGAEGFSGHFEAY